MFEFIRGTIVQSSPVKTILDVGGIGYGVHISLKTFHKLPSIGGSVFLYLSPIIREDEHLLFGFLTIEEKELFEQIKSVNGVGPKTAMGILGHMDTEDFNLAIAHANTSLLSKLPGIGKKSAERLIVELKGKIKIPTISKEKCMNKSQSETIKDAISALINLGYHPLKSQQTIEKIVHNQNQEISLSCLITDALRLM